MYLGFYPETMDRQKIAWIGTLLTDTALSWHLHRYRDLGEADTWVNYSAAIRAEYHNEREAADAQLKLGQLKYQGSIRAYLTEFRALNNFARATGEALREKVDLAMPDTVLDMRFAHYLEDFADDEGFLQATHQAGLQVEKKKALRAAKEAMRAGSAPAKPEGKKDDRHQGSRRKEENRPTKPTGPRDPKRSETRSKRQWESTGAALQGVPQSEVDKHKKDRDSCWRCGRPGHRTNECYSFQTVQGTELPSAPWKVAMATATEPATTPGKEKRKRENEPDILPDAKQQKVSAADEMITDLPIWESDSDF